MERTIKVTGKSKISVRPDTIRLVLNIVHKEKKYEEIIKQSSQQLENLKDCVEKLGFKRSDLKTSSFNIDTRYENYQEKDRLWKKRLVEYELRHNLKIEFAADNIMLGKMLDVLSQSKASPEIHIVYTVKDEETVKNELLAKAIEDSKNKAEVMAAAAGVGLGEIISIDYSWQEMEIISLHRSSLRSANTAAERCNLDIEPEDINVSDTVTVIWSIR